MTDAPLSPISLPAQMGAHARRRDDTVECWIDVHAELCSHRIVRASVLVMMIDMAAGWVAERHAESDWTFTVDIGMRRTPLVTSRFEGTPTLQRAGRTMSVDVPMRDAEGNASATGVSTFARLPKRPNDPDRPDFPEHEPAHWPRASAPLDQLLDPDTTAAGLSVGLRPELLNPAGILQGGVAALLAEVAAQRRLEADGANLVVTSFDVRYVTMGRVGPIEAVVEPIGPRAAVVKLFDRGADDALVTHNLIGFSEV